MDSIINRVSEGHLKLGSDPLENKYFVAILYDIVDNKRRSKFKKYLEHYGYRVQRSVFEAHLTRNQIQEICQTIKQDFYYQEDKVRLYVIKNESEIFYWGENTQIIERVIII